MGTARVQGQRDVGLNELPIRGLAINDATANTAAVTVYASDSGILFVNKFATAATYTLPAVADAKGKMFWFYNVGAAGMVIKAPSAIMVATNNAACTNATFGTANLMIGAGCMVFSDGTSYYLMGLGTSTITPS